MAMLYDHNLPGILIDDNQGSIDTQTFLDGRELGVAEGKAFVIVTRRHLDKLRTATVGRSLVEGISKLCVGGASCVITYGVGSLVPGDADANRAVVSQTYSTQFTGEPVRVSYNPFINYDLAVIPGLPPPGTVRSVVGGETPGFVALAHELIHALHRLAGERKSGITAGGAFEEEAWTVGAGKYAGAAISENAIRKEHGLVLRRCYVLPGDCA